MSNKVELERVRGKGVYFSRIRRITGYLTGDLTTWGDSKRAELHDRTKHINIKEIA